MARYRCPSASYEDIGAAGQVASSSKNAGGGSSKAKEKAAATSAARSARAARKHKDKAKAVVIPKEKPEEKVKEQARAAQKKEHIRAVMKSHQQTYLYVGNLSPDVSDLQLERVFQIFGPVRSVTLRSARGCPRTIKPGMNTKGKERLYENKMYASVVFKHAGAVHRAMGLNGTGLNGQPMAIVRDALDLPEFKDIINGYKAKVEPMEPEPLHLPERKSTVQPPVPPEPQPEPGPSALRAQSTTARIALQFRSRANGKQHEPNTRNGKSTRKR